MLASVTELGYGCVTFALSASSLVIIRKKRLAMLLRKHTWVIAVLQSLLIIASFVTAWLLRFEFSLPYPELLVACRSEFVTADAAGGVRVLPLDGPSIGGVGVDIAAELAS